MVPKIETVAEMNTLVAVLMVIVGKRGKNPQFDA